MEIKDSGERREFGSGAVRDCAEGKGRCDLLALDIVSDVLGELLFESIDRYIRTGDTLNLHRALVGFMDKYYPSRADAILDVAKQYEEGAKKYAERNWEKGIPLHCYIDSGVRHLLKFIRGDKDEPHDRAFMWNMFGALWTHENHPELIDLPFKEQNNE